LFADRASSATRMLSKKSIPFRLDHMGLPVQAGRHRHSLNQT